MIECLSDKCFSDDAEQGGGLQRQNTTAVVPEQWPVRRRGFAAPLFTEIRNYVIMENMDSEEESAAARLQALEDRISALEDRGAGNAAAGSVPAGSVPAGNAPADSQSEASPHAEDTFWVLNGLKDRMPDPGAVVFAGAVTAEGNRRYEFQYALTTDAIVEQDWSGFAGSLAALGHPVRLQILHGVLHGIETVAGLAGELDAGTTGQLYHHVNQLVSRGWLAAPARGHYQIPAGRVVPLLAILTAAGV